MGSTQILGPVLFKESANTLKHDVIANHFCMSWDIFFLLKFDLLLQVRDM